MTILYGQYRFEPSWAHGFWQGIVYYTWLNVSRYGWLQWKVDPVQGSLGPRKAFRLETFWKPSNIRLKLGYDNRFFFSSGGWKHYYGKFRLISLIIPSFYPWLKPILQYKRYQDMIYRPLPFLYFLTIYITTNTNSSSPQIYNYWLVLYQCCLVVIIGFRVKS